MMTDTNPNIRRFPQETDIDDNNKTKVSPLQTTLQLPNKCSSSANNAINCINESKINSTLGSTQPSHHQHNENESDVIGQLMGQYGKYQFYMTFLLSLFQVPNTFHISSSIYQAAEKDYWCRRPAHLSQVSVSLWRNISNSTDNCNKIVKDWSRVSAQNIIDSSQSFHVIRNDTFSHQKCSSWEFATNDSFGNTWTSEWNLVCDKEYLKNVAEMFFLVGVATGGIISGYLSDRFGRKVMLFISVVFQTIFGIALYFVNTFELYLALRGLLGLVSVSVTYAGLILAIEFVDGKWRTIAGMYNLFPLPVSYMLISGIAYLTQDYRLLQLCIGLPGLFLCFLWFVIPESPRWLLCKGRITEVKSIVKKACKVNGITVPSDMDKLLKPPLDTESEQGCLSLFASRYLRLITACFLCIWFTMNLVYYGLILNMNTFGGNVYLNSALAGLVELPAIGLAIFIIMKIGKKWILCATLFFAALSCLCIAVADSRASTTQWLKITFLMIGKFTISAGNTIMPVYTAELYPTAIRNAGVGACNVAAGLALIIVPYLSLLNKIEPYYLMSLLTGWSLFGSLVVIFLPESLTPKHDEPTEQM